MSIDSTSHIFKIITVTYNDLSNLQKTFRSILGQTFKNYEWIVIDGGSMDGTTDFLKSIESDYPQLRWISEKDNGIYDAMNKGLSLARGDYIVFMNAGDCFTDEKTLSLIYEEATNAEYPDFIYGDAIDIDEAGTRYYRSARSEERKQIGMFTHHQSMVYKREIIEKYRLRYDTSYKIAADYKFTCEFLEHAATIHRIPQPISIFLQGGVSQRQWMQSMREQITIKQEVLHMPSWKVHLTYMAQIAWHGIKDHLPWLYRAIRFRKNAHA